MTQHRNNILARLEDNPNLIQADIAVNKLFGGEDETISSRVGKTQHVNRGSKFIADRLNAIDPGHTERAVLSSQKVAGLVPFTGQLDQERQLVPFTGELDQPAPVQAPTRSDIFKRQLGLMARLPVQGAMGTGVAAADFLTQLNNLGRAGARAAGLTTTPNAPLPSSAFNQQLNRAFGEPKGFVENLTNIFGSGVAGSMTDPILRTMQAGATALAPQGFTAAKPSAINQTRLELRDAGYKLPPTEAGGSFIARGAESLANKSTVAAAAAAKNQDITQGLAAKALNLPATEAKNITEAVLKKQANQLLEEGYAPIKNIPNVNADKSYVNTLVQMRQAMGSGFSKPLSEEKAVADLVRSNFFSKITGEQALDRIKNLRRTATEDYHAGRGMLGEAKIKIASALEDNIETSLNKVGQAGSTTLQQFRSTREALAKNYAVNKMLVDKDTGIVSTTKAYNLGQESRLTDELATIAKAGSPMFSKATGVPVGGVPSTFTPYDYVRGLLSTGIGYYANHPLLGAAVAAYPAARWGARVGTLSNPVQNIMARNLQPSASLFGSPTQQVMQQMPQQILPLFSQGEGMQQLTQPQQPNIADLIPR